MITFTVAHRVGNGDLPIPISNTFQHRLAATTGGSLLNDVRMNAQTVMGQELYQPLVYAYWAQREVMNYNLTNNRLVEDADVVREVHLVNVLVPHDDALPTLVFGSAARTKYALQATAQAIKKEGGLYDYKIPEYDLKAISTALSSDQWMWSFGRDGNVSKGKLFGNAIELDQIFSLVSLDSEPNEVGVTLQIPNASLMVRILSGGRIQFYNFSSSHVWERNHDEFGDPIPLIYQTIDDLRQFELPNP